MQFSSTLSVLALRSWQTPLPFLPHVFRDTVQFLRTGERAPSAGFEERLRLMGRHLDRMIEVFGETHGCRMFRKVAPWYARAFGPARYFNQRVVQLSSRVAFEQLLDGYREWRCQFVDEQGELLPRFRPVPPPSSFLLDAAGKTPHIPLPRGPVERW